jgi:tRNA threonylcarbamoyladenosine biosynthesis protein TsaE
MKLRSRSDSETREIGRRLGDRLKKGDVVCLYGELGAGKTTFVKGIARAFGIDERDITSASFTIIVEHEGEVPFFHIDLYRLNERGVSDLGLNEYLGREGVAVIEWAERAESEIPDDKISVRLDHAGEDSREIEINGIDL